MFFSFFKRRKKETIQLPVMEEIMREKSTLYFCDTGGKFSAVKDEALAAFLNEFDLTIYSLRHTGEDTPSRLILRMTPIGMPDGYLSMQSGVYMLELDYQTFPVEGLKRICEFMRSKLSFQLLFNRLYMHVEHGNNPLTKVGPMVSPITLKQFFSFTPCEDDPGAKIYLRDKAFFLSLLPDPRNPTFFSMQLLTEAQKHDVVSIDLSNVNVSGEISLPHLFEGYSSVRELDLSAFDTSSVTDMHEMFFGCESLQKLDLSTFDFSKTKHLQDMFGQCPNLKEVILSDTILGAGRFPHLTGKTVRALRNTTNVTCPYADNDFYCEDVPETIFIPFSQATEEERYSHLGLKYGQQKITVVPHRAVERG